MTRHERVRAALGRLARTVCEAEGLGLLDLARGGRAAEMGGNLLRALANARAALAGETPRAASPEASHAALVELLAFVGLASALGCVGAPRLMEAMGVAWPEAVFQAGEAAVNAAPSAPAEASAVPPDAPVAPARPPGPARQLRMAHFHDYNYEAADEIKAWSRGREGRILCANVLPSGSHERTEAVIWYWEDVPEPPKKEKPGWDEGDD